MSHYNKRSNAESVFSSVKRKFGGSVRSKLPIAQQNEVLCKFVAHNLSVLVHSIFELGIEPTFWPELPTNQDACTLTTPAREGS